MNDSLPLTPSGRREEVLAIPETQQSICNWANATFGTGIDLPVWYTRLMEEIGELGEAILDEDAEHIAKEAADAVIMLTRIVGATGRDLQTLIDAKMAINRAAEWNFKNGVGHRKTREPQIPRDANPEAGR